MKNILILSTLLLLVYPMFSSASYIRKQTIENDTGGQVNDLKIRFKFITVDDVQIKPNRQPPGKNAKGKIDSDKKGGSFAKGSFGGIANDDRAEIRFSAQFRRGGRIDSKASQWTLDGVKKGNVKTRGGATDMVFDFSIGETFATFFNPEDFDIVFNNIFFYIDNDSSNFSLDDFDTPSGILVPGPSSVMLAPNESFAFSLGANDPLLYDLVFADVSATNEPENLFSIATGSNATVAEPTTLLLFSFGTIGLISLTRNR